MCSNTVWCFSRHGATSDAGVTLSAYARTASRWLTLLTYWPYALVHGEGKGNVEGSASTCQLYESPCVAALATNLAERGREVGLL